MFCYFNAENTENSKKTPRLLAVGDSNGVRFLRQILRNTTSKCSIIHKVLSVLFPCLAMNLLQKLLRTIQVLKIMDFWCGKCSWADALQTWQSKKTWFLTFAERAQFESPTAKPFPYYPNLSQNTRFLAEVRIIFQWLS